MGGGISLTSWAGVKELPDPRVVEVPMGPLNADGLPPTPLGPLLLRLRLFSLKDLGASQ